MGDRYLCCIIDEPEMTEKVFWIDMYLKEITANVTEAGDDGILLDRTIFYPTGGGQPNDTGYLHCSSGKVRITDVRKSGDEVLHVPEIKSQIKKGDSVRAEIDWDRRYSHMRYHSAIHVIDGVMAARHGEEGLLTGGQIYTDHARIDMDLNDFSKEFVDSLISECNSFISGHHRIYQREISSDEALKIPNISRTEPGRELLRTLQNVRTIVIEGLDEQADGGTHVRDTSEIGLISLQRIQSKGKRNKRIEFTLSQESVPALSNGP